MGQGVVVDGVQPWPVCGHLEEIPLGTSLGLQVARRATAYAPDEAPTVLTAAGPEPPTEQPEAQGLLLHGGHVP